VIAIIGVMADKDAAGLLTELEPVVDHVIAVDVPSPRSLPADELATLAGEVLGPDRVTIARTLVDAYEQAVALLDEAGTPGGGIVVTGSVVLAGAARDRLSPPSDDDWDGS
jgi:dihydrofolate synthase/folylpolyglutamate synthase